MSKPNAAALSPRGTNGGTNRTEEVAPAANRQRRDEDRERRVLAAATGHLDGDGWSEQVATRLDQGQRDFGDAWAERGAAELLAEATEEAADLAAWSLLAEQSIDIDASSAADLVRHSLSIAMRCAAHAHTELTTALALLGNTREDR